MDTSPVSPAASADAIADNRAPSKTEALPTERISKPGSRRPRAVSRRRPRVEVKLDAKGRLLFYLMVGLLHVLSLIPDLVLYSFGALAGRIAYYLDRRHVKIGMKNLAIAFPERSPRERKRILRASYVNMGRSGAEYIRLGGFFHRRLRSRVRYERFGYWEEIKRKYPGRGALILTAHFGNFELLPAAHAMHGYQISLVHHTQRFLAGDALISFVRNRAGVSTIRKHAAARAVLKGLRNGELIGIPFDQNAKRSEAIFVPFFGEPAATSSGLARLTVLSGAPVIPVFIVREADGHHHRIEIREEIPVARSADARADLVENTGRFVKAVEDIVRRYPEQFLWTHRRYRTRPRGMPKVYG
jgi:Kdo2-lipid IVA lauroyltransferase/acyltransferase